MASLPLDDWFRVLDKLAAIGIPHIILTGGEPTLHPDLPAIIRHADGLGLIVGMNTNGRLLSHAPTMAALAEAGLNHVQITLETFRADVHDAMVGAPGAFAQTVRGIENALASGVPPSPQHVDAPQRPGPLSPSSNFFMACSWSLFRLTG